MILGLINEFNASCPETIGIVQQRTYYLSDSPEVIYCDKNGNHISKYEDLPEIKLTTEEQELLNNQPDPKLNEPQVLIKEVTLKNGKVFLEAYKCNYKLLAALGSNMVFATDSPVYNQGQFFKVGSIAIISTSDAKTAIVERNDTLKLWSSFSGFLETKTADNKDLAAYTAEKEAYEEFFQYAQTKIQKTTTESVSLRKGNKTGRLGTVEFIANLKIDGSSEELRKDLDTKLIEAKTPNGKSDHTGRYLIIDPTDLSIEMFDIKNSDGSNKNLISEEAGLSFMLVKPIIATACKCLGIKPHKFIEEQSLNDIIAARQLNKSSIQKDNINFAANISLKRIRQQENHSNEL